MRHQDIVESKHSGSLAAQVEAWAASVLRSYFDRHPRSDFSESKQIHDPVSGTVYIRPWELFVLDSPLMQRLRYIRQLGIGQVLFPTSAYSRFDHSIGAMHAASSMFDVIMDRQVEGQSPTYSTAEFTWRRQIVRLAALLHDIGHCVFSHVSETYYEHYPLLVDAQRHYRQYYSQRITASESLSLLILQSDAFIDLLVRSKASQGIGRDEEEIMYYVRACIAGSKDRVTPDVFMAEIVNGPVDCDKLDYLARDAHTAGVPIALDTGRLLSKLRLADVTSDVTGEELHALAIVLSGTRALDELLVSRIFLFDKFYYHQKLMAAEEVVRSALRLLGEVVPDFANPVTLLDFGDDALLHLRPEDVAARYSVPAETPQVLRATELLRRVRHRDLPKRAFAFGMRFIPRRLPQIATFEDPGVAEDSATDAEIAFSQFARGIERPEGLDRFAAQVATYAEELGVGGDIFVAHQVAERVGKPTHLPMVLPGGGIDKRPPFLFKAHEWTEAYAINRATSYIFAYEQLPKVHLAAERALHENGLPFFAPGSWLVAKVAEEDIERERYHLDEAWVDYRMRPDFLRTTQAQERIHHLRERFGSFLNAWDEDEGPQLVETWTAQFPTGDLQDSALRFLSHITYVEPSRIVDRFHEMLEQQPELRAALWIPFVAQADPGKSADQLIVDLHDLQVQKRKLEGLDAEVIRQAQHVVFFDDSINTGTQALTLLRSWVGAEPDDQDPQSDRDSYPLSPEIIAALKEIKVSFVFYAGHPNGEFRLRDGSNKLGLGCGAVSVTKAIDLADPNYSLDNLECATPASKLALLEFMKKKGTILLQRRCKTKGWPAERPSEYALGFGDLRSTVVFRHSISTATPAVLWEMIRGPNEYWIPLFPRKRKELRDALRTGSRQTPLDELPEYLGA